MVSPHFCCFSPQLQSVAAPGPKNGQVISYMNFHGTLHSRSNHNIRTPNANPNPVGVLSPYPPSARLLPWASPRRQLGQQPNHPNGGRPWLPHGKSKGVTKPRAQDLVPLLRFLHVLTPPKYVGSWLLAMLCYGDVASLLQLLLVHASPPSCQRKLCFASTDKGCGNCHS